MRMLDHGVTKKLIFHKRQGKNLNFERSINASLVPTAHKKQDDHRMHNDRSLCALLADTEKLKTRRRAPVCKEMYIENKWKRQHGSTLLRPGTHSRVNVDKKKTTSIQG